MISMLFKMLLDLKSKNFIPFLHTTGWLCLFFTVTGCSLVNCLEREDRQFGEIVVPVVTGLIKDVATALFHKILNNWLDPDNVDVSHLNQARADSARPLLT